MEMFMYRIYSTGIETAAASAILIPILFLYQIFIFHNIKKTAAYIIFTLYLTAMCFLVGFPSAAGIKISWSYNFIPLYGIAVAPSSLHTLKVLNPSISISEYSVLSAFIFQPTGLPCSRFKLLGLN